MKVYVHNYTKCPTSLSNKGFFAVSGTKTYYSTQRIVTEMLDEPYNQCYKNVSKFELNKTLVDFIQMKRNYSQQECIKMCENMIYKEKNNFGCNFTVQSLEDDLMTSRIKDNLLKGCIFKYLYEFQNDFLYRVCPSYCPLECDSNQLVVSSFTESYPNFGDIKSGTEFKYTQFKTFENVSKRFISIVVYYEYSTVTLISQQAKWHVFDLVSNIGGSYIFKSFKFKSF